MSRPGFVTSVGLRGWSGCRRRFASCATSNSMDEVLRRLRDAKLLLCVRRPDVSLENVHKAILAAISGGVKAIEVTMDTPHAITIVERLRKETGVLVGTGTVISEGQVNMCEEARAHFVMSPITDTGLIKYCNNKSMLMIPGAMTPTEVHKAYFEAGARAVKVFPFNACGGTKFVTGIQGPFPDIPLLPASGVDFESFKELAQQSNVLAIGVSKQILSLEALRNSDWGSIEREASLWVKEVNS
uniref:2-dehydro-3-deoxy-phosphogluconate aldolase n=1 Tax=Rhodosorus marinus TaxID=101924 RepID=A0A7S0G1Y7_9RHOD|mmetsp:Transcript_1436/g.2232  ORF Transcript_1436/g.2232 Transcript_1436/m.2232 type:complete len:243 (+) Transcript_1436:42-770(+)